MYLGSTGAEINQSLICFGMALAHSQRRDFERADKSLAVGKNNLESATRYIKRAAEA